MNIIRAILGKDLDAILRQFHKIDQQLDTFLASIAGQAERNERQRSILNAQLSELADHDEQLNERAGQAQRVQSKIKALVA